MADRTAGRQKAESPAFGAKSSPVVGRATLTGLDSCDQLVSFLLPPIIAVCRPFQRVKSPHRSSRRAGQHAGRPSG
jgi:hypothetical protein